MFEVGDTVFVVSTNGLYTDESTFVIEEHSVISFGKNKVFLFVNEKNVGCKNVDVVFKTKKEALLSIPPDRCKLFMDYTHSNKLSQDEFISL